MDGEIAVLFPPGLLEKLNLSNNQFLLWELGEEVITIRKKVSATNDDK